MTGKECYLDCSTVREIWKEARKIIKWDLNQNQESVPRNIEASWTGLVAGRGIPFHESVKVIGPPHELPPPDGSKNQDHAPLCDPASKTSTGIHSMNLTGIENLFKGPYLSLCPFPPSHESCASQTLLNYRDEVAKREINCLQILRYHFGGICPPKCSVAGNSLCILNLLGALPRPQDYNYFFQS
ncbi:unnamed protein product [Dovyalis caffra]|uniref:Uncharacterized protein n=1 Tax=Dovyalis caffra TaxID=77055 RepID=A0AAV1R1H1_9ROSI|nr:unnamed protein product [Dovyalis caffra]